MKSKVLPKGVGDLFKSSLESLLDMKHELIQLSQLIEWDFLEDSLSSYYDDSMGRRAKPIRLMAGLLMLQHAYKASDEGLLRTWLENPYWQYFCGYEYLETKLPIHPTSLVKFRKKIGKKGIKIILGETLKIAIRAKMIKKKELQKVIVDTTVQPKNVTYPTDAKNFYKGIKILVKYANKEGVILRQNYTRVAKAVSWKSSCYFRANQFKRAQKQTKKLKTFLGRIYRDIQRKTNNFVDLPIEFQLNLCLVYRLLNQKRNDKNKLYSFHEPLTECIFKGKVHKKYEFGVKVGLTCTHKSCFVIGIDAFHGNPYDGHILKDLLTQTESITKTPIDRVYADKGFKGHCIEKQNIFISGSKKGLTKHFQKELKRRPVIEPVIGHMKNDGKFGRNFLKGTLGDHLNAILCGIGYNLRFILNRFRAAYT